MKSASDVLSASGILTISSALLSSSVSTTRGRKEAEAAAALFARRGASPVDSIFDALSLSVKTLLLNNVPVTTPGQPKCASVLLHFQDGLSEFRWRARSFFLPARRYKPGLAAVHGKAPAVLDVHRAVLIPFAAPRGLGRRSTSRDPCALKPRGGYKCQGNGLTCVT
jgi:hypothetical protein